MSASASRSPAGLCALAIQWGERVPVDRLVAAWPEEQPGFRLVVVDNGPGFAPPPSAGDWLCWVSDGCNLGFAGGIRRGLREIDAERLLILNPDARPVGGALAELQAGFDRHPEAAALAPRLVGSEGETQHRWQLRPLPSASDLLAQCLFLERPQGPDREPEAGSPVEQPAAAALAIDREQLERAGGFDPAYYPAWFEDVDLARRLRAQGAKIVYWPSAEVRHGLGGSVPALGYAHFLWVYYRNLVRYARTHHGRTTAILTRVLLAAFAPIRVVALPLRQPRRAPSRAAAARGLAVLLLGALSGWRLPGSLARRFAPPREQE